MMISETDIAPTGAKTGFANDGLVQRRIPSIDNLLIQERDRKFNWDSSGPRPADHPGLSDLDL
jgi:nuclear transport factor 2 (NTF2) superfamily protein